MKIAIIKASQLGLDCWSPKRFFGFCDQCDRVMKCKLPEARAGRIKLLEDKIEKAKEYLEKLEKRRVQEVLEGLREETKR